MVEPNAQDASSNGADPPVFERQAALEAVPMHIVIADGVDLDADDPAQAGTRRLCIAERRAGGRCPAAPMRDGLLCAIHAGLVDASSGGLALAQIRRDRRREAEHDAAAARAGTRAVIAAALFRNARKVEIAVQVLLDAAAEGDVASARLLLPYIDQALGRPTETTVSVLATEGDVLDLDSLSTAELEARVRARRAALAAAAEPTPIEH